MLNLIQFFFSRISLVMRSIKCSYQSPEWPILGHINCFTLGEVVGFRVLLDSLHPYSLRPHTVYVVSIQ